MNEIFAAAGVGACLFLVTYLLRMDLCFVIAKERYSIHWEWEREAARERRGTKAQEEAKLLIHIEWTSRRLAIRCKLIIIDGNEFGK